MSLRKKERVLTPAEFKAKQKRDYTPFWFNSEVIFGANLYPVADTFTKQVTIVFLLDVADFTTERIVELLQYWEEKYGKLNWQGVIAFEQKYAFLKNQKFFERFKGQKIFIDTFGELFQRFGSEKEPVAVVLKNGEFVSSVPLLPNFPEMVLQVEQQLQISLRAHDPGLPLPATERLEPKLAMRQQTVTPEGVSTFGEWNGNKSYLITEKNASIITCPFKGKQLRLIAMAHPNARDSIKVSIMFNEKPLSNALQNILIHDISGVTQFEINKVTGIYDLINVENELTGIIKLTFLNAFESGAVFYEFKIA